MKHRIILLICIALCTSSLTQVNAQRGKRARKAKAVKVAAPAENPKFTAMLESTAKVTIADSTVTDSLGYLNAILTNREEGSLYFYHNFFNEGEGGIVYVNQLGSKSIYAIYDEQKRHKLLYQSDLMPDGWTQGEPLKGIDDNGQLTDFDYPYLMPDGITLYFAAKGAESIGGYDIYRTRYDADAARFLKPENLGLPFNSEQDDFMFVVDEQNQLGYFATNRHQPAGKCCVYTFVPFESRTIVSAIGDERKRLARIDRIADTWTNRSEKDNALSRKTDVMQQAFRKKMQFKAPVFSFVVNDHAIYTTMADFKLPENRTNMQQILDLQKQLNAIEAALAKTRNYYTRASSLERQELNREILENEQLMLSINDKIHQLEKHIRNTENQ